MGKRSQERQEIEQLVDNAKKLTSERGFRIGLLVGAVITIAIGIFIFQNNEDADLQYLWADFNVPLWMGLLASFAAGCLAAPILGWSWRRHRRLAKERKEAERGIKDAEKHLT